MKNSWHLAGSDQIFQVTAPYADTNTGQTGLSLTVRNENFNFNINYDYTFSAHKQGQAISTQFKIFF